MQKKSCARDDKIRPSHNLNSIFAFSFQDILLGPVGQIRTMVVCLYKNGKY